METLIARKNCKLVVSDRQEQILIGSLLGDAYISPRGQIQIEQSEAQKPYLFWKYDELRSLAYGSPIRTERFDRRYYKRYSTWRFWLRQYFRPWRKRFYPSGEKVIPESILYLISPLSLAVWYMDDGNFSDHRCPTIATNQFSEPNLSKLVISLNKRFNLKISVSPSRRLYVLSTSVDHFFELISSYVVPSLRYKLS